MKHLLKFIMCFALCLITGCANIAEVESAKHETAYRKHLQEFDNHKKSINDELYETVEERSYYEEIIRCENFVSSEKKEIYKEKYGVELESDCEVVKVQRVYATPIEMPKEWLDQWPSLRENNE